MSPAGGHEEPVTPQVGLTTRDGQVKEREEDRKGQATAPYIPPTRPPGDVFKKGLPGDSPDASAVIDPIEHCFHQKRELKNLSPSGEGLLFLDTGLEFPEANSYLDVKHVHRNSTESEI